MTPTRLDKVLNAVKRGLTKVKIIKDHNTIRVISTSPRLKALSEVNPEALAKFKKKQAFYQCEDGNPIWLKNGTRDKIPYYAVLVGCVLGTSEALFTIYNLAKPASWRKPPPDPCAPAE